MEEAGSMQENDSDAYALPFHIILAKELIYSIQKPEHMLFDIDSTLLQTYGEQEGEAFQYHYQNHGYHPLSYMMCWKRMTVTMRFV